MSESWDDYTEGWDSKEDVIAYSAKAFGSLCEFVDPQGQLIFDFGCGTGLLTEQMAITVERVVAVDSSIKMILTLRNKYLHNVDNLTAIISEESIKSHELHSQKFVLVVASSVCTFLPNYEETLCLLKTLLKPSGIFIH